MTEELTEYEKEIFAKVEKFEFDRVYKIPMDRPDREKLIAAFKKYIDVWNNFEFNSDYTKFRRIPTIAELEEEWEMQKQLEKIKKQQK